MDKRIEGMMQFLNAAYTTSQRLTLQATERNIDGITTIQRNLKIVYNTLASMKSEQEEVNADESGDMADN